MRSVVLAATASLCALVSARPEPVFSSGKVLAERDGSCMSADEAQQVATNFKDLIASYSDSLANQTLTTDFTDTSDSVTTLIDSGCTGPAPLGATTFASRAAFEAGQGSQPAIPFEQLNLWHNCDNVFLRWRSTMSPEIVTGIIVLETTKADASSAQPWLINTVYSEFNSGAWLVDLGVFTPSNCSTSAAKMFRS